MKKLKVAIAGASGFVGRNLLPLLPESFEVRALSRSQKADDNIEWVQVDLFSFTSTVNALSGVDIAIYLVHSMLPSSKLFQGNFQDTDLFLADNFARACKRNKVKQIIYLGGLIPLQNISHHLQSRKEVEEVFNATGIPCTILRAGMVVGDGGSSFEILKNLVINLPAMILPKWTQTQTQTIFLTDLLRVIKHVTNNQHFFNSTVNVVNGEKITYADLIEQTAKLIGKKEIMLPVPINYLALSKLWVKLFGQADYELVSPLIDSLVCELPAPDIPNDIAHLIHYKTYQDMLTSISPVKMPRKLTREKSTENTVRSIQRLPQVKMDAGEIGFDYLRWLPKKLNRILVAKQKENKVTFHLLFLPWPLLELEIIDSDEALERIKFHIVGGILSKTKDTGWLEFRKVVGGKYTLASINEFIPSLPWPIYRMTQAPMHKYIMDEFGKHLTRDLPR